MAMRVDQPTPFGTLLRPSLQVRLHERCEETGEKIYKVIERAVLRELDHLPVVEHD